MAENIFLEIVTPDKLVVSEESQIVVAPGIEGQFGALQGHTTFLSSLQVGGLRYKDTSGKDRYVFINSGFAEVLPDKVTVLAESAERRKDVDLDRAQKAKQRAEERLAKRDDSSINAVRAEAALKRAIHRIAVKNIQI